MTFDMKLESHEGFVVKLVVRASEVVRFQIQLVQNIHSKIGKAATLSIPKDGAGSQRDTM